MFLIPRSRELEQPRRLAAARPLKIRVFSSGSHLPLTRQGNNILGVATRGMSASQHRVPRLIDLLHRVGGCMSAPPPTKWSVHPVRPDMRILLAEDDPRVASFIRKGLEEEQFQVQVAGDGERA